MEFREHQIIELFYAIHSKTQYLGTFHKCWTKDYIRELFDDVFAKFPMLEYSGESEIKKTINTIKNIKIDSTIISSFVSYWATRSWRKNQFHQYAVLSTELRKIHNELV